MTKQLAFKDLSTLTNRLAAKFKGSSIQVPFILGFSSKTMSDRKRKKMCGHFLEEAHNEGLLKNWSASDYDNDDFHRFLLRYLKTSSGKRKVKTPIRQLLEEIAPYLNIIYHFDGVSCIKDGLSEVVVIRKNGTVKAYQFPSGTIKFGT